MEEPSNTNSPPASSSTSSSSSPSNEQQEQQQQQRPPPSVSYRVNISISDSATSMRDEAWSCIVVLITFWFFGLYSNPPLYCSSNFLCPVLRGSPALLAHFGKPFSPFLLWVCCGDLRAFPPSAASMTLILGFYGSINLQLGPNCSRLIRASSLFVQNIEVKATAKPETGPVLYGFTKTPPLDVETTWSETHSITIPVNFHKEWVYYLNKGSHITVSYSVKSEDLSPLSLVISQGNDGLLEWMEDPSYPNTTLSWNIIYGNGSIQQKIPKSSDYYIAVGNLNPLAMEVELNFTIHAFLYNTTGAYHKCSVNHNLCGLKLFLFGVNTAVLATPGPQKGGQGYENWYVKLSYGPRWITYFVGSGGVTILILLACKIFSKIQNNRGDGLGFQAGEVANERTPLLIPKDDDTSSWGSSYDSVSHDEEDLEDWPGAASLESKVVKEGENSTSRRVCAVCFDSPRDCFFLPCGHCATCFTCGTRIAEEASTCPICRRKMKKVRKIFAV